MLVNDKVAVITGGASGIGRATAERYAEHGAEVIVADVDSEGGRETVQQITDHGGSATFVETDVSEAAQVKRMIETAVNQYDGIDVLFNNAGIVGALAKTHEYDEEQFDRIVSVNLRGAFLGMKYGIRAMLNDGGGSIVNTSSIAAEAGILGRIGYAGTKAGLNGMTRVAASEYAPEGIRVNSILPGTVDTPMHNEHRTTNPRTTGTSSPKRCRGKDRQSTSPLQRCFWGPISPPESPV